VTFLFRTREWLSLPQLVDAWGLELAKVGDEPDRSQKALEHILLEDIINGRLDDTGPLRKMNGRSLGVRLEFGGVPSFVEGHEIRPLVCCPIPAISLHRILIMKEAVLDFAKRHQLPPPSWWADRASLSADTGVTTKDAHSVATSPTPALSRTRGRKPEKPDQVKEAMREDIRLGRLTPVALRDMPEKNLAARYDVSRDTARKALDAVLPEILPAAAPDRT
jgi:Bacterial regulatory proteins, gntR family